MEVKPAKKRKGIYKFVTRVDLTYKNTTIKIDYENDWLQIKGNGDIIVKGAFGEGYAWDGCTPKWNVFDLFLLGTPDGRTIVNTEKPITYHASLVHDVLCQFQKDIGISRKEADRLFLMYLGDFELRYLYYFAVRVCGVAVEMKASISSLVEKNL
jgi:hypothetical protein